MKLLRGRIAIREDKRTQTTGSLWTPEGSDRDRVSHRGKVLAMGDPPLTRKGFEVPPDFAPGDEVIFHFEWNEKASTRDWVDGLPCVYVTQECVDAVVE